MTRSIERRSLPVWMKLALTIFTPLALFYLLVLPMLAAQSPKSFGVSGVLFGAFMLIQLFMLVGVLALDSAAAFYSYQPWLALRRRQAQYSPYRSDPDVPPSWALVLMMLSYSAFNYAFAVVYVFVSSIDPTSFSTGKALGVVESMYFSTITAATVGYGDIAPKTDVARLIVVAQVSVSLLYVIILFSAFASYVREQPSRALNRVDRQATAETTEPDDGPSKDDVVRKV